MTKIIKTQTLKIIIFTTNMDIKIYIFYLNEIIFFSFNWDVKFELLLFVAFVAVVIVVPVAFNDPNGLDSFKLNFELLLLFKVCFNLPLLKKLCCCDCLDAKTGWFFTKFLSLLIIVLEFELNFVANAAKPLTVLFAAVFSTTIEGLSFAIKF